MRYLSTALAIVLVACLGSRPDSPVRTVGPPPVVGHSQAIDRVASRYMILARDIEPAVSSMLRELASDVGGKLVGFEHRFKERLSMIRKLRLHLEDPSIRDVAMVRINDSLRYTIGVDDEPHGHHTASIRRVLEALEGRGHVVLRVKNYWPRGDNYSGVNCVLLAPNGLEWELQFHTTDSLHAQKEGRPLYEEMRLSLTPVGRKRELFKKLAAPWNTIPVPVDILRPKSLHETEEIILRPKPN